MKIVAPIGSDGVVEKREATGPAPVHSPISLYASLISPSTTLTHSLPTPSTSSPTPQLCKAYIHVVQTSGFNAGESSGAQLTVSGADGTSLELREGDGAYIVGDASKAATLSLLNTGDRVAEVLLFDVE